MDFIQNFNVDRFLYSLQYMWQGMLSIFIVIAILILMVVVMNKLTGPGRKKKDSNK